MTNYIILISHHFYFKVITICLNGNNGIDLHYHWIIVIHAFIKRLLVGVFHFITKWEVGIGIVIATKWSECPQSKVGVILSSAWMWNVSKFGLDQMGPNYSENDSYQGRIYAVNEYHSFTRKNHVDCQSKTWDFLPIYLG